MGIPLDLLRIPPREVPEEEVRVGYVLVLQVYLPYIKEVRVIPGSGVYAHTWHQFDAWGNMRGTPYEEYVPRKQGPWNVVYWDHTTAVEALVQHINLAFGTLGRTRERALDALVAAHS